MSDALTRRDFLGATGVALTVSALGRSAPLDGAPAIRLRSAARPMAVGSANAKRGIELAMQLVQSGSDTLDAAVEGVKIQELDPADNSVGYGGLPNEEGVVQLDASCMHGPSKRAGAVGALENIKTPSEVAKLILKYTNHILLVGDGAKRFALSYGFKEEDLLTPESREEWLRWRANRGHDDDWLDVPDTEPIMPQEDRHGKLECGECTGRNLLGHHDQWPGMEDSGPSRGFTDYWGGPVHRQRDRRGWFNRTGRGQHHGVWWISHGGAHASGNETDRRRTGDACERVVALTPPRLLLPNGTAQIPAQLLRREQEGRGWRRRPVSEHVRHIRRQCLGGARHRLPLRQGSDDNPPAQGHRGPRDDDRSGPRGLRRCPWPLRTSGNRSMHPGRTASIRSSPPSAITFR